MTLHTFGYGVNIGHGYVKGVRINGEGVELPPVIFPALVAPAGRSVAGALVNETRVKHLGETYWVGESALMSEQPLSRLDQSRIVDPVIIPVLVRHMLRRFGALVGAQGYCVTGLPTTWMANSDLCHALGARLRDGAEETDAWKLFTGIKVIDEPLGAAYDAILDTNGEIVGPSDYRTGQIGVVDLGHNTVDVAVLHKLAPVASRMATFELGTAGPLNTIRALVSGMYNRQLTTYEADMAAREGVVRVRGEEKPLPSGCEAALRQNGDQVAEALASLWRGAHDLDVILVAGGGSHVAAITDAIRDAFPHATILPDGQLAIARGYAKLARRHAVRAAAKVVA